MTQKNISSRLSHPDYEGSAMMRATVEDDLDKVMEIIDAARDFIAAQNIDQWTNGYPLIDDIRNDIDNGWSYVLLNADKEIVGTAAVSFDGEPTYHQVFEGNWEYEGAYAVVHRLCIDPSMHGRGYSGLLFAGAEALAIAREVRIIRVDTHEKNKPMRRSLVRAGYEYRGKIKLANGDMRVAYEKYISSYGEDSEEDEKK